MIVSSALAEERIYTVFGAQNNGPMVYSLDGGSLRNGLFPVTITTIASWTKGQSPPKIVAVHSNANRNRDFRPAKVQPEYWRPDIAGRSADFDRFLLDELMPQVEKQYRKTPKRYLFSHSLSGLYALEVAARQPDVFAGVYAFSPTFSHDMSIQERLAKLCRNNLIIYANIGLESGRDSAVFDKVSDGWTSAPECKSNPLILRRHPGILHALIMTTGQIDASFFYMR